MIMWESTGKTNDFDEMDEYGQLNTPYYTLDTILESDVPLTAYHISISLEEDLALGETEGNIFNVLHDLERQGYVYRI